MNQCSIQREKVHNVEIEVSQIQEEVTDKNESATWKKNLRTIESLETK